MLKHGEYTYKKKIRLGTNISGREKTKKNFVCKEAKHHISSGQTLYMGNKYRRDWFQCEYT